jgi:hypothetical protein
MFTSTIRGGKTMKKSLVVLSAAAMVAAAAVPALAFENEFHGMYRSFGYLSNAYSGGGTFNEKSSSSSQTSNYVEQRARLQYIAKANDDLKLVTHFELDSLFGGKNDAKYRQTTDSGVLDADGITIETKNVYLDFNVIAPVNVKLGIQPYTDNYQGVFGNFDGAGVVTTGKFGIFTPSLGWFRVNQDNVAAGGTLTTTSTGGNIAYPIGKKTTDFTTLDVKAAINKDLTVGGSYYLLTKDSTTGLIDQNNAAPAGSGLPAAQLVHTLGLNAAAKVGPAALNAFAAYQFGEFNNVRDLSAYSVGGVAKVKAGPGNVNLSALYLSGDKDGSAPTATGKYKGWQQIASSGTTSYFGASNMWLLIRNNATINTSTAIGSNDLTKGGRGLFGMFAGYDGAAGKVFYAANAGYAQVAETRGGEKGYIGTELNATVGYKLYDSLSVGLTGAYAIQGAAAKNAEKDGSGRAAGGINATGFYAAGGAVGTHATDPYVALVKVDYAF